MFIYLNGCDLTLSQDEAVDLILDIAKGLSDLDEIEDRLNMVRRHSSALAAPPVA